MCTPIHGRKEGIHVLSCFQMLFSQIQSQEFELQKMTSFCRMEQNFFQKWFISFGQKKEEKILDILWAWGFSPHFSQFLVSRLTTTYHNTRLTLKVKARTGLSLRWQKQRHIKHATILREAFWFGFAIYYTHFYLPRAQYQL